MESKEPLVSIALCTYNGALYINEQLNSILSQTYQNLEIIIVDDCSTDRTFQMLEEFQKKDSRIQLFKNDKNLGFNLNFNKALSLTNGAYIAISDQDDIWDKEKIAFMLAHIHNDLLFYHDSVFIDENSRSTGNKMSDLHRFVKGNCEDFLLYHNCISGHAFIFDRKLLNSCLPFPTEMYYDWWMAYTAACLGKINFTKRIFVQHRRHSQSSTSKEDAQTKRNKNLKNLIVFRDNPLTSKKTKKLISDLILGYEDLRTKKFSFKLFSLLLSNTNKLFYTRRRSFFSTIKFIIKECSKNS